MARTRTSDQTLSRQHAKPLVYACLVTLMAWLGAAAGPGAEGLEMGPGPGTKRPLPNSQAPSPWPSVPCVSCQVLSVTPDQVSALPGSLAGVRIVVRTGGADRWDAAVASVAERGARAGLHVTGVPDDRDPLLAAAVDLLILEPADAAGADVLAFDLKRALSAARGRHPAAALWVAVPPAVERELRARGVAPYVDAFVDRPSLLPGAAALLEPAAPDRSRIRLVPPDPAAAAAAVR